MGQISGIFARATRDGGHVGLRRRIESLKEGREQFCSIAASDPSACSNSLRTSKQNRPRDLLADGGLLRSIYDGVENQHHQWFMSAPRVRRNRVPLPSIFGREVRRRRVALGLTLEQLAERSGLTPNYIGTVENGRRDPSLSTVMSLAEGLGVPAGELVGGVAELGPVAIETARLLEGAPPELQTAILELARAIAKRRR